jgi:hypothetical protein
MTEHARPVTGPAVVVYTITLGDTRLCAHCGMPALNIHGHVRLVDGAEQDVPRAPSLPAPQRLLPRPVPPASAMTTAQIIAYALVAGLLAGVSVGLGRRAAARRQHVCCEAHRHIIAVVEDENDRLRLENAALRTLATSLENSLAVAIWRPLRTPDAHSMAVAAGHRCPRKEPDDG